jgi:hypothetical protein
VSDETNEIVAGTDVEGPVQAEVFVLWLHDDRIELTGPCGSDPWLIEVGADEHPLDVVSRIVRDVIGEPILVHSTSWRRDRGSVILSFVVIIEAGLVGSMASTPVERAALARSEATAAPRDIAWHRSSSTACATSPGSSGTIRSSGPSSMPRGCRRWMVMSPSPSGPWADHEGADRWMDLSWPAARAAGPSSGRPTRSLPRPWSMPAGSTT